MKYSEFEREVEKMGLNMDSSEHRVFVRRKSGNVVFTISKSVDNFVDCGWASYLGALNDGQRGQLFDLAYQLAKTPLAEREEEKRYYLRFIHPNILGAREPFYLHLHHSESAKDYYDMGTVKAPFGNKLQTIFTESEIAQMDTTGFEKIEVTE